MKTISKKPLLVLIGGPTASGKTTLAVDLAKHYNTEVLSADSRQFYDQLQIGTARPTTEELKGVPHHFLGFLQPDEPYTAGQFEKDALAVLEKLFTEHSVVFACGGSGMYLQALADGIDNIPSAPEEREKLIAEFEEHGIGRLQDELLAKDPEYYHVVDLKNHTRLIRALEVIRHSGKTYTSFRQGEKKNRPFRILKLAIDRDRKELYNRINERAIQMIDAGLVDEVKQLLPYRHHQALNSVGYKETFAHLDGEYDLNTAIRQIQKNTRNFAKRQMTWFRNQDGWEFLPPAPINNWNDLINQALSHNVG